MTLDKINKKILAQLEINSRNTYKRIGKNVGLSSQAVKERIIKMENQGIIKEYILLINSEILGYTFFNLYIKTHFLSSEKRNKIIEDLKRHQNVGWLASFNGQWDLKIAVMAYNKAHFEKIYSEINFLMKDCIVDSKISQPLKALICGNYYLHENKPINEFFYETSKTIKLSKNEFEILKALDENSKISLVDLAEKTNLSMTNLRYYIKKMESEKIILGYSITIDFHKLGYHWNYILFKLTNYDVKLKNKFIEYLKGIPNTFYIINTIGDFNLTLELLYENALELEEILSKVEKKFDPIIQRYDNLHVVKEYKHTYLTKDYRCK